MSGPDGSYRRRETTQSILAWFDNTFQGAVNVSDALSSGRLELTLLHQPTFGDHDAATLFALVVYTGAVLRRCHMPIGRLTASRNYGGAWALQFTLELKRAQ